MIETRLSEERGHAGHGWLDSRHTFSFSDYYDKEWMGYGTLRVINEDRVVPGAGFSPHSHRDMEIISYVLDGGLKHRDSTGGESVLRHGEIQLMSAGRGITHSEMNASPLEPVHFLQIWVQPNVMGVEPGYQQKQLDETALRAGFSKVIAPAAEGAPFSIHQDARIYIAWASPQQELRQVLDVGRRYYLQVARGEVQFGARRLVGGDAAMLSGETALELTAAEESELLLFDLPAA